MPSGFEAIQMISNSSFFNETIAPAFERIHLDHFPPLAYAPDTVGQMTAAGRTIYSKTLEEELAELDFVVSPIWLGFGKKRINTVPITIGRIPKE